MPTLKIFPTLAAAALVVTGLMAVTPARAAVFDLTADFCTGGCGTPPFGSVTVVQDLITPTTVDVTVHLNSPFEFAKTGAADFQAFKFNAVGVVLGDITVDAHVPTLVAAAGSFNGDGTGSFGFGINCPSCGNGLSDAFTTDIVFHVANAVVADLTAKNANGNIFVADIGNPNTGRTGPVAAVPAPSIGHGLPVALAVGGLLIGAGLVARRRGLPDTTIPHPA